MTMRAHVLIMLSLVTLLCILSVEVVSRIESEKPWRLTDVTGYLPDLSFLLVADSGKPVTEQNYRGNIVLLYFGFTQCPDLCPVTMARVSGILRRMGDDADHIRILFVTVDPAHDTPSVLRNYLKSFEGNHITGLTGEESAISNLTKRYRAAYQHASNKSAITHSDTITIFDADGHARLIATDSEPEGNIAADLLRLVHADFENPLRRLLSWQR